MQKSGSLWTRLKGKLERPVADAAGDRKSEAKAGIKERTGREPRDSEIEAATESVRRRHHDI